MQIKRLPSRKATYQLTLSELELRGFARALHYMPNHSLLDLPQAEEEAMVLAICEMGEAVNTILSAKYS